MIKKIATFIIGLTIGCLIGFFTHLYFFKPKPQIIVKETKYNTIEKDIDKMPIAEIKLDYKCYLTNPITIDINPMPNYNYMVKVTLCDRKASKEFKAKVAESGNWKYYIIGGVAVGVIGAGVLCYALK